MASLENKLSKVIPKINKIGNGEYELVGGYIGREDPITLLHKCGNILETTLYTFQKGYGKCRICYPKISSLISPHQKPNYLENILKARSDGHEYKWLEEYKKSNKAAHRIQHVCGYEFTMRPNDFQQGRGCARCNGNLSAKFKQLLDAFTENSIDFVLEYKFEGYRFDCYLPDYNLIIEFDGEQHFRDYNTETVTYWKRSCEITKKNDIIKNDIMFNSTFDFLRISYLASLTNIFSVFNALAENNVPTFKSNSKNHFAFKLNDIIYNFTEYYTL